MTTYRPEYQNKWSYGMLDCECFTNGQCMCYNLGACDCDQEVCECEDCIENFGCVCQGNCQCKEDYE